MLNPTQLLEQKKQLEAQLQALNESIEKNKDVIANYEKAVEEINKVKEKYKFNDADFINLIHSNFKKEEKMVWVKVGDKAQLWQETKRGALSGELEKIVKAAGLSKYSEYVKKFTITEEEAKKLNEAQ
ncbi:hypothetical protein N1Z87_006949 [Pseudomonas aeruginosa]|nr:hypothetical protein [Pseudomonas aeruginosa]